MSLTAMQMGSFAAGASILSTLFFAIFPWIGLGAVAWVVAQKAAPQISPRLQNWFARRYLYKGIDALGGDVCLLRERDGRATLAPYEYDADNGVVWVDYGDEKKGFDASGMGQPTMPFLGGSLTMAYDGLGAVQDIASARIGFEAAEKYADRGIDSDRGITDVSEGGEAVADGGAAELDEHEISLPERGVVADLRDVMNLAPYNVRPSAFNRVEKNAKAGLAGYANWGPVAQTAGMLGAFFLGGLMVWFVTGDDGGSTSTGAEVVPMMIGTLAAVR